MVNRKNIGSEKRKRYTRLHPRGIKRGGRPYKELKK